MKKKSLVASLVSLAALLAGCQTTSISSVTASSSVVPVSSSEPSVSVSSSSIAPAPEVTLAILGPGKIMVDSPIGYKVTFSDGKTYPVTWTSSDAETAHVGRKGAVTGYKAGKATITVALTDYPDIKAEKEIEVVTTLPTIQEAITNIDEIKNYTVTVTKDGADYQTGLYTENAIAITDTADSVSYNYALGADGYAFQYDVGTDGTITAGERLKTLGGYVTADTFFGDPDSPYDYAIPALGNLSVAQLPAAPDEEGGNVYTLTAKDTTTDRDSFNLFDIVGIADVKNYGFGYMGRFYYPTKTAVTATVTDVYGVTFDVTLTDRKTKVAHNYQILIENAGKTVITDGIEAFRKENSAKAVTVDANLTAAAAQLKGATSFEAVGYNTIDIYTDTYLYSYYVDSAFDAYYDPLTYDYGGHGYVKRADGIYSFSVATTATMDISTDEDGNLVASNVVITRGTPVLGVKVEGTDADSTMKDTFGYASTLKILDAADTLIPSGDMYYNGGLKDDRITAVKDYVNDVYSKAQHWGSRVFDPSWALQDSADALAPRFAGIDASGYNADDETASIVAIMIYYNDSTVYGQTSYSNSYTTMSYTNFNHAKSTDIETWIASLAA